MELERMVNEELRRREKAGEYGPILPHPTILLQYEKEVYKELKKSGKLGDLELERKKMYEKVNVCASNIVLVSIYPVAKLFSRYLASIPTKRSSTRSGNTSTRGNSATPNERSRVG